MSDKRTVTHIDSSSSGETYEVVLVVKTKHVHSSCTCKAGIFGGWCKHKLTALTSLGEAIHSTDTWTLLQERSAIDKQIESLRRQRKAITDRLEPTCHRPGNL